MRQLSLDEYEDFHETREELRRPDVNFTRCFGCRLTFPETELEGGFCKDCRDFDGKEVES